MKYVGCISDIRRCPEITPHVLEDPGAVSRRAVFKGPWCWSRSVVSSWVESAGAKRTLGGSGSPPSLLPDLHRLPPPPSMTLAGLGRAGPCGFLAVWSASRLPPCSLVQATPHRSSSCRSLTGSAAQGPELQTAPGLQLPPGQHGPAVSSLGTCHSKENSVS